VPEHDDWPGVSQSALEAAGVLGDLVPTVHPQKKEAKGWVRDEEGTGKVYYTSEDLRTVARGCMELAQFLDDRAG
jgi:hypothetical protein